MTTQTMQKEAIFRAGGPAARRSWCGRSHPASKTAPSQAAPRPALLRRPRRHSSSMRRCPTESPSLEGWHLAAARIRRPCSWSGRPKSPRLPRSRTSSASSPQWRLRMPKIRLPRYRNRRNSRRSTPARRRLRSTWTRSWSPRLRSARSATLKPPCRLSRRPTQTYSLAYRTRSNFASSSRSSTSARRTGTRRSGRAGGRVMSRARDGATAAPEVGGSSSRPEGYVRCTQLLPLSRADSDRTCRNRSASSGALSRSTDSSGRPSPALPFSDPTPFQPMGSTASSTASERWRRPLTPRGSAPGSTGRA